jgi:antirestriction protein
MKATKNKQVALGLHLGVSPDDLKGEKYECYGMAVFSHGNSEYAVGDENEANDAWDQSLDSYLEDCGLLDSIPENLRNYFDREAWKRDAKMDGRGHSLASYDGDEIELEGGYVAFRIN